MDAHLQSVVQTLDQLLVEAAEAESTERSYFATTDNSYVMLYSNTVSDMAAAASSLGTLMLPDQDRLTQQLLQQIIEKTNALKNLPLAKTKQDSNRSGAADEDIAGKITALQDNIHTLRDVMRITLSQHENDSRTTEADMSNRMISSLLSSAACISIAIIGLYFETRSRQRMMRKLQLERLSALAANRTKSSFLAYTSHELRTPLNAIIGFSEFMMMEYAGPLTDRQKQYLSDIRGSGLHLQALISDILDLTKAEAGKITLTEQRVNIPNLVSTCIKLVEGQAKEAGVKVQQLVAPDLPLLRADELRCKQILINVAINAIQFTPKDGAVTIEAMANAANAIVLTVRDNGPGIPQEDISKAIEPYFRSGIDEPNHKGYGLGLPLARKIAELHGGTLTLNSEPGRGSIVQIFFPAERTILENASGSLGATEGAEIIILHPKTVSKG